MNVDINNDELLKSWKNNNNSWSSFVMRNNTQLKFQGQWLMGPSLGRGALGSISHPFGLLDSRLSKEEWKGMVSNFSKFLVLSTS